MFKKTTRQDVSLEITKPLKEQLQEWGCDAHNPRLQEIILNRELVKIYFGEYPLIGDSDAYNMSALRTIDILGFLQRNENAKANAYFLRHTIFNPKNRK